MQDAINRLNRDRQGGHQTNLSSLRVASTSPAVNKMFKKNTRKKLRREHAKVIRESLIAMDDDHKIWLEELGYTSFIDDSYYENRDYREYLNEQEQLQYEEDFDPRDWDESYDYNNDPFYGLGDQSSDDDCSCDECVASRRVQPRDEVPVFAPFWTSNLGFNPYAEVVNKGDAGKTLGELLRERASRQS